MDRSGADIALESDDVEEGSEFWDEIIFPDSAESFNAEVKFWA